MTNEAKKWLLDVVCACEAITTFVVGKNFTDYAADHLLRSGVERQFEIIGEAPNKAGAAEPELISQIPDFHRIVGLRNRLVHGYDNVDDEILWDVVQSKLVALEAQVQTVLRESV